MLTHMWRSELFCPVQKFWGFFSTKIDDRELCKHIKVLSKPPNSDGKSVLVFLLFC